MLTVGAAVAYLDLDTSKFSSGLESAGRDLKTFTDSTNSFDDRLAGLGSSMGEVGSMATTSLTLPIVGAAGAVLKYSTEFEAAMGKVQAISGASGEDMERLEAKAKEMGATTKFSASEAAEAFQYMAMAGWDTDDMLNSITGILNLAAADNLELGLTSDIVTDAMTAFGLAADGTTTVIRDGFNVEVSNAEHFADILAATSSSANTNVSMLGESFKYVAPMAGAMGYKVEDTALALGLMANAGIKASQGGTTLRNVLGNLTKPTDEIAQAMDYLGVSLSDGEGKMYSLREIMGQLRQSMSDVKMPSDQFLSSMDNLNAQLENGEITEKKYNDEVELLIENTYGAEEALKAKYAATLAGKEGLSGLLAIVNASEEDFNKLADAIDNSDGKAMEMAGIMNDTAEGQITLFQSAIESLALAFSDFLLPPFTEIVKKVSAFVGQLSQMDESTKQMIVTIGLVVAAVGPVLLIMSKLIGAFLSIKSAIGVVWPILTSFFTGSTGLSGLITGLAGPVGIMIALVVALVTAWVTNFGGIRDKTAEILEAVKIIFDSFLAFLSWLWENKLQGIRDTAQVIWEDIKQVFQVTLDLISDIFRFFEDLFSGNWSALWTDIKNIFSDIWELILGLLRLGLDAFLGLLTDAIVLFLDAAIALFTALYDGFQKVWKIIMDWWAVVREDPIKYLKEMWPKFKQAGKEVLLSMWEGLKGVWEDVKSWFNGIADWISNKLSVITGGVDEVKASTKDVAGIINSDSSSSKRGPGYSHYNGLGYVPYDGYKATLHEGERVLTKEENEEYNGGHGKSQGSQVFNFYGTPPLNEKETARQFKKSQQQLALGY